MLNKLQKLDYLELIYTDTFSFAECNLVSCHVPSSNELVSFGQSANKRCTFLNQRLSMNNVSNRTAANTHSPIM